MGDLGPNPFPNMQMQQMQRIQQMEQHQRRFAAPNPYLQPVPNIQRHMNPWQQPRPEPWQQPFLGSGHSQGLGNLKISTPIIECQWVRRWFSQVMKDRMAMYLNSNSFLGMCLPEAPNSIAIQTISLTISLTLTTLIREIYV